MGGKGEIKTGPQDFKKKGAYPNKSYFAHTNAKG